jgi:hypothetical protein
MHSFLELPTLHSFDGRDAGSIYVNTSDIITLRPEYQGQTRVTVRDIGADGTGSIITYVPLESLLSALGTCADSPQVIQWVDAQKHLWAAPVRELLQTGAQREREASRRAGQRHNGVDEDYEAARADLLP